MGLAQWLGIGKTVADVTEKATTGVADIITVAKGDIPPEAKGEIEKLKVQISGDIEKLVQNSVNEARDFALQYEGTAAQVPKWLLLVRSLIRPTVTVLTFGWFFSILCIDMFHIAKQTADYTLLLDNIPQGFWWILGIILTFWFGGKVGERVAEKVRQKPN
jgi:hypothetical protein